jgi:hypothetical protein
MILRPDVRFGSKADISSASVFLVGMKVYEIARHNDCRDCRQSLSGRLRAILGTRSQRRHCGGICWVLVETRI